MPLPAAASAVFLLLSGCLIRRTYPDAEAQVVLRDLGAPVEILVDALGVAHVYAADMDDGAAGLGFMHARDRGFQLEVMRLVSQGRLSELFGSDVLDVDRRLRLLTLSLAAQTASLSPTSRARLTAYCAGINQGMLVNPRPAELRLLKHHPEPWTPQDVVAVGLLQAWSLSHDAEREALRDWLRATLGDDGVFAALSMPTPALGASILEPQALSLPPQSLPAPPTGLPVITDPYVPGKAEKRAAWVPADADALKAAVLTLVSSLEAGAWGSNGFAVSGSRTADGRPILAGDPHLSLSWPPVFYEAHLHTPAVDVSGATFPGLPMVVIGRSDTVAWTATTSYADLQALYRLEVEGGSGSRYKQGKQWVPLEPWPQTFRPRGEAPVQEVFYRTVYGPVYNAGREASLLPGATYALSWPGFREEALPLVEAFDALYAAATSADVQAAVEQLVVPSQSWVYALASGEVGMVLGGALPAAVSALPQDGTVPPLSRSSGRAPKGWEGPRPAVVAPADGVVIASNQPFFDVEGRVGTTFSGAYRALRQRQILTARSDWTPAALRGVQMDTVSLEAARFLPVLLKAVLRPRGVEAEMLSTLGRWDYGMDGAAAAPLIYEVWRSALHRRLLAPHVPTPALREALLRARLSEAPMEVALMTEEGRALWDDPATSPVETREEAIRAALADAERELTARFGDRVDKWRWAAALTLTLEHPFASRAALRPWFGVDPVELSGGRHTILSMDHNLVVSEYGTVDGPALRQVVVPGPGGEAGFVLPGGNAGQPNHPHALDQLDDWQENRQHAVGGAEADITPRATATIRLSPS